jgi:hypothetical protein
VKEGAREIAAAASRCPAVLLSCCQVETASLVCGKRNTLVCAGAGGNLMGQLWRRTRRTSFRTRWFLIQHVPIRYPVGTGASLTQITLGRAPFPPPCDNIGLGHQRKRRLTSFLAHGPSLILVSQLLLTPSRPSLPKLISRTPPSPSAYITSTPPQVDGIQRLLHLPHPPHDGSSSPLPGPPLPSPYPTHGSDQYLSRPLLRQDV